MKRKDILEEVASIICKERQDKHGKPEDCFQRIADHWNLFLQGKGVELPILSAQDVAIMMVHFKLARIEMNPATKDSTADAIGYLALYHELNEA